MQIIVPLPSMNFVDQYIDIRLFTQTAIIRILKNFNTFKNMAISTWNKKKMAMSTDKT
jgi:hypothetical protein